MHLGWTCCCSLEAKRVLLPVWSIPVLHLGCLYVCPSHFQSCPTHTPAVLNPRITYEGLKLDFANDPNLLADLERSKDWLQDFYKDNYAATPIVTNHVGWFIQDQDVLGLMGAKVGGQWNSRGTSNVTQLQACWLGVSPGVYKTLRGPKAEHRGKRGCGGKEGLSRSQLSQEGKWTADYIGGAHRDKRAIKKDYKWTVWGLSREFPVIYILLYCMYMFGLINKS